MTRTAANNAVVIRTSNPELSNAVEDAAMFFDVVGLSNRNLTHFAMSAGNAGIRTVRGKRPDGTVTLRLYTQQVQDKCSVEK